MLRRSHPKRSPRHPVEPEWIDDNLVRLELEAQEIFVVLDAQRGERVRGMHTSEQSGKDPVKAPNEAADDGADRDHLNRIEHQPDELPHLGVLDALPAVGGRTLRCLE